MQKEKSNPLKQHDLSEQENITLREQRGYSIQDMQQDREDNVGRGGRHEYEAESNDTADETIPNPNQR